MTIIGRLLDADNRPLPYRCISTICVLIDSLIICLCCFTDLERVYLFQVVYWWSWVIISSDSPSSVDSCEVSASMLLKAWFRKVEQLKRVSVLFDLFAVQPVHSQNHVCLWNVTKTTSLLLIKFLLIVIFAKACIKALRMRHNNCVTRKLCAYSYTNASITDM